MPPLRRFDLGQTAAPSDDELERRWSDFHRAVRANSSSRIGRLAGAVAGESTVLARTLRRWIRPALAVMRHRRHEALVRGGVGARAAFPTDYDPSSTATVPRRTPPGDPTGDVLVIVIDEVTSSVATVVNSLNDSLAATAATWILLLDVGHDAAYRDAALEVLLDAATAEHDVVFSDEPGAVESRPVLKPPTVGPHTLLSYNVVGRPAMVRVAALRRVGGFHATVDWAFEHDAYLRLAEAGAAFHHVARVLGAGRAAHSFDASHIDPGTRAATDAALVRRGWRGTVERGPVAGVSRWRLEVPSPSPSVDIIIPTRDRIELVRRCIESIEQRSTYANYQITILDNDSLEAASRDYFGATRHRVVACPGPFNYAKIVNRGVEHSTADFVVTLNNDTVVLTADWLEQMVALAALDDVGVVGTCLLDAEGHHEHDGLVIAPYPQHLRVGLNYPTADQFASAVRDVSAVTGAVQMVERRWWQHLGGMDEELHVVMNDVDLCLRSHLQGRLVVFTPDVALIHEARSSRGDLDPVDDRHRFMRRWDILGSFQDPYVAESLELLGDQFHYRTRP